MTTQEIAIKYGVPMPETCIELNWQGETIFTWYFDNASNNFVLCNEDSNTLGLNFFAKAPQMHEIAPLLPMQIGNDIKGLANFRVNFVEAFAQMYLKVKRLNLLHV